MKTPAPERFWAKVRVTPSCWEWTAAQRGGYGAFSIARGRVVIAHRWAYEASIAPIPDGMELDHTCRNRLCVNPAHLEPVTHTENMRRAYAAMTHCKHGHSMQDAYTYTHPRGYLCRRCRECARVRTRPASRTPVPTGSVGNTTPAQPNESRTA